MDFDFAPGRRTLSTSFVKKGNCTILMDRNYTKKALFNRKGVININTSSQGLSNSDIIIINENLTQWNNKIAYSFNMKVIKMLYVY